MDIPGGVILGQYVGNEMMHSQYLDVYNGTKEEMEHLTYLHGESLRLPDGEEIDIDGIAAGKSSPFLYINDGRQNMECDATEADRKRMNTEFASVLCNGWPLILVVTTKTIRTGQSLWIPYGPRYRLVREDQELMEDQRQKAMRFVAQILRGIDLEEERPIQIFDKEDEEYSRSNHHKKRRLDGSLIHRS